MGRGLHFPFQLGDLGTPRTVGPSQVIRQQLEQLLFTLPGERVNRPRFGCGVQRMVFGAASPEAAAAAEYIIRLNVQEFMRDQVRLDAVKVSAEDATLYVDILYTLLATGEEHAELFRRDLEAPP
ncbi:GPW/gp25 family protein [Corallococcus carmarthensis]|uniref:GPW/gp25 family protein n=1 Tax=Corallococcus carmarthensis TaxID=2316728 RepID=UPI00148D1184|nr:GPW/gp25 family protein [Corallococcus carmarthensis]NOK18737.1 GPW/gp25 family protein [Corallococcus carmarthensis]